MRKKIVLVILSLLILCLVVVSAYYVGDEIIQVLGDLGPEGSDPIFPY